MNLLEFNDAALSLYRNGQTVYRQPGIAHAGAERLLFGIEALRIARLHPQQSNQQYLARLNADPLPVPGKLAANHADLVYLHLLELQAFLGDGTPQADQQAAAALSQSSAADRPRRRRWDIRAWRPARHTGKAQPAHRDRSSSPPSAGASRQVNRSAPSDGGGQGLIAAVPGSLTIDQLGVLLGIAQEAGIDIQGFVDSAVLMASTSPPPADAWLLDLHLTRACLTELNVGEMVTQTSVQELPGCGLISCMDGWANLVADRFVQDTRFDPLHAANTEQQLYDQLYDWAQCGLKDAEESYFTAEIRHGGHERQVRLSGADLRGKLMQRFQRLAQKLPGGAHLLVAPRSAAVPGLLPGLGELGFQAEGLAGDALERGFARHANTIASGQLTLVSRLPAGDLEQVPAATSPRRATHVLFESRAWPLDGNPFGLPSVGHAGDTVRKDGRGFQLIAVEPESGRLPGN